MGDTLLLLSLCRISLILDVAKYTQYFITAFPVPPSLTKYCVYFATSRIKLIRHSESSNKVSPIELFTGRRTDYKIDLRVGFGDYVQAHTPQSSNNMDPRSTGCIALLPTGNKNGSVLFYSLATGKVITRDHITPSNLQHVSTSLGLSKKMKWASSQEIYVVGWFGLSIFSILVLYSTILLYFSPKILLPRLFFISIILSSVLDLPRYIFMVIDREYTSIVAYACHILSNYFFFLSLTLVCVVWAHLLQFGSYTSFIYRGRGVILTNFILAIISIISFLYCLKSTSLEQFLDSTVYSIYRGVEVIENLFYSIVVAFFGIKLVIRFKNYAASNKKNIVQTNAFRKALKKVALTLCLNALCSTIRILLILFFLFHDFLGSVSSPYFRKYGVVWFTWSDFIPKGVATIAFLNLMNSRNTQRQDSSGAKSSWTSNFHELELEQSNYNKSPENRDSEIIDNPVNHFDVSHDLAYPDEYHEDTVSVSLDDNDRHTQSSASFWESPTAAQDALHMMTKHPEKEDIRTLYISDS